MANIDTETVIGFGAEWATYDQSGLPLEERNKIFEEYFELFPWAKLPENAVGFDLGCGSGRWAQCVAPRVGTLHCIDASADALQVAQRNLANQANCEFHLASVDNIPLAVDSMDFGYSLGVLHHVPDTAAGISACVERLKPGAPFLLYLYYAFDNRPTWFRTVWRVSDIARRVIARLPFRVRRWISFLIAVFVYFPLAQTALILERAGINVDTVPLSGYRHRSFYTMRTDALDRFGTRLEQRFTAREMHKMMEEAGLEQIMFSESVYWCAVGKKKDEGHR